VNVAVTDFDAFIVTVHPPIPVHAPPQPANVEAPFGVAVRVTLVPSSKGWLQSVPQLIPAGELITVPPPLPDFVTVSTGFVVKVAVTDLAAFIMSVQVVLLPVHAPPHPAKVVPPCGAAVRVTPVPGS
jgi:hypothetical protein